jgi:hypothetical protein
MDTASRLHEFSCRWGAPSSAGYMVSEELIPVVRSLLVRPTKVKEDEFSSILR